MPRMQVYRGPATQDRQCTVNGRIRTIKPELLDDEVTAGLSDREFRLLIGCILGADDLGNLRASARQLRAAIWWARDDAPTIEQVQHALDYLASTTTKLLEPYSTKGQRYAHIRTWDRHQKIDKPGKPKVPSPSEADMVGWIREDSSNRAHSVGSIREALASGPDPSREPSESAASQADPPGERCAEIPVETPAAQDVGAIRRLLATEGKGREGKGEEAAAAARESQQPVTAAEDHLPAAAVHEGLSGKLAPTDSLPYQRFDQSPEDILEQIAKDSGHHVEVNLALAVRLDFVQVLCGRCGAGPELRRAVGRVLSDPHKIFPHWQRVERTGRIRIDQLLGNRDDRGEYEAKALVDAVGAARDLLANESVGKRSAQPLEPTSKPKTEAERAAVRALLRVPQRPAAGGFNGT